MVNDILVPYERNARFGQDPFQIIKKLREGITYQEFEIIVNLLPFSTFDWSLFLHISDRTLLRYKVDNKRFDATLSERIIQIFNLYEKGVTVFEDNTAFNVWLKSRNVALGGIEPFTLLDSSYGIEIINQELIRIEYGIFA
jgi:putative toxin-antitoxin system antitoxin component (TIGR02293 family)